MNLKISKRAISAPASPIRKLSAYADEAKKKGIKVYHLNIGQPDLKAPVEICGALSKCSKIDYLPYEQSQGTKELLSAWRDYLEDDGIKVSPENILITSGGSEGLILACAIVCNPNEEILTFEPFYANYLGFANLVSAKISPVQLDAKNGYHLPKKEKILAKITPKTRAILLNNPNNPTGTVFTKDELKLILKIARKFNLFIISDEAYGGICFDGCKSVSIFALASKEDKERIIIIDSLSKKFNVCGARIGAVVSTNKDVLYALNCFAQQRLSVSTLDQKIVFPALEKSKKYIKEITKEYEIRRNVFLGELESGLKTKIHYPKGAFYTMIKLPVKDADDFAKWLLTDFNVNGETVMVAPGSGFYATKGKGRDEIRVAFVLDKKELKKAARILIKGIEEYSRK
ncbi:MAG: pyridoxal phosphate-dependent aminotransferase [Patescibacteria group bacterium]|nr:pyridoxal phosphate-dependent aminotransferase [Patescibacteria group bacterium]MCL5410616.1 pyridoxal phosphate-dependent aminotransferase [Patescibacteria group bacterium]